MRKFVAALALVVLFGLAGAQKFGVYMDYAGYGYKIPVGVFGFGGYYGLNENLRLGGGVEFSYGVTGISGRVDYVAGRVTLLEDPVELELYYGGEASVAFFFASSLLTQINVDGLLGVEYVFPKANLGIFSELIVGPSFLFGAGDSTFGIGYGGKFGLNFY